MLFHDGSAGHAIWFAFVQQPAWVGGAWVALEEVICLKAAVVGCGQVLNVCYYIFDIFLISNV